MRQRCFLIVNWSYVFDEVEMSSKGASSNFALAPFEKDSPLWHYDYPILIDHRTSYGFKNRSNTLFLRFVYLKAYKKRARTKRFFY